MNVNIVDYVEIRPAKSGIPMILKFGNIDGKDSPVIKAVHLISPDKSFFILTVEDNPRVLISSSSKYIDDTTAWIQRNLGTLQKLWIVYKNWRRTFS